jgi:hypothetical protein
MFPGEHPFQALSFETVSSLLIVFWVVTLLVFIQLSKMGKPLRIPSAVPKGILSLEFASTARDAQRIVHAWSEAGLLEQAIKIQWLDFLFIVFYSTTFSLTCIWSTQLISSFNSLWLDIGIILAWSQLGAALFDVLENLCLFPFLYSTYRGGIPLALVAATSATLKFGLIILGLAYILISIGIKLLLPIQIIFLF